VGDELTFSVSVPNEKAVAMTSLKIDIPYGMANVTPTVKAGWTIKTDGSPDITSITWSEGAIPVDQREDFTFGAQVPGKATDLDWKAYQTYTDGTAVRWDQKPAGSDDATGNGGPYSVTKVTNDLTVSANTTKSSDPAHGWFDAFTIFAFVMALAALIGSKRR
jgi:uncharacterized protein YcnI